MRLISLDTETSGLDPQANDVLAIGAVDIESGAEFYAQIRWDRPVLCTPEAMKINGLSIHDGIRPDSVMSQFIKFLPEDNDLRIIGMNPRFDREFVKECWEEVVGSSVRFPLHYRTVDINSCFVMMDKVFGEEDGYSRKRIEDLAHADCKKRFINDSRRIGPHHALYDAWHNVFMWDRIMYYMREEVSV